jgi:hypothetical protein
MRALSTTERSHLGEEWSDQGSSKVMFHVRDEVELSQSEPTRPQQVKGSDNCQIISLHSQDRKFRKLRSWGNVRDCVFTAVSEDRPLTDVGRKGRQVSPGAGHFLDNAL